MTSGPSLPKRLFRFLGEVQFTMVLLLGGGVAMAVGTLIDSQVDAQTAKSQVYQTLWFDFFLLCIAVNLIVAVINRLPIKRHQWPFVLTHVSIVLLLVGAWISRTFGYEGSLAIAEGSSAEWIELDGMDLRTKYGERAMRSFSLGELPREVVLQENEADDPRIEIFRYEPKGEFKATLVESEKGAPPGVEFHLKGKDYHTHDWLLGETPRVRRKDLGPVEVAILVARDARVLEDWLPAIEEGGAILKIRVRKGEELKSLSLDKALADPVEIEAGLFVKVEKFVQRARVEGKEIVDDPAWPINPAVIFQVSRGDRTETHTVYSQFPQFNMVKGRAEQALLDDVGLQSSDVGDKLLIRIISHPETQRIWVQLSASVGRGFAHPISQGKTVVLGNTGYEIRLDRYLPHAQYRVDIQPAAEGARSNKWLGVRATIGAQRTDVWVRHRSSQVVPLAGKELQLAFGPSQRQLPFSVFLEQFDVSYHPGSQRARQYASKVVIDTPGQPKVEANISMNRPFDHEGYRLFQSGFTAGAKSEADVTFLSVSFDPGARIVYLAFILLIVGVAWYVRSNPVKPAPKSDAV